MTAAEKTAEDIALDTVQAIRDQAQGLSRREQAEISRSVASELLQYADELEREE